jgi:hypothetical protein
MYVELYGTGGGRQVIVTTTEWEKYDATSWLTPGTSLTGFSIYGYSLNDTYLDDVVMVPEPSVPTLIAAAWPPVCPSSCVEITEDANLTDRTAISC